MIDFTTLKGLTIPEGVVTKITDASGIVLWKLQSGDDIVLTVQKITGTTYAGSTSYSGEEFFILDIYPKSGGTVTISYGDLTKTITDDGTSENPNAQQVFFGTFNGVSDSVATPASGTLTIKGDCAAVGQAKYNTSSKASARCCCISGIDSLGKIETIPESAFSEDSFSSTRIFTTTSVSIPEGVTSIGSNAFYYCTSLCNVELPNSLVNIDHQAFAYTSLKNITLPKNLKNITGYAFNNCTNLYIVVDDDNPYYLSEDGALFNKSKTSLIFYQSAPMDYTIPSGLTEIGEYAFANSALASAELPEGITTIGTCAFFSCDNLASVSLPDSITTIKDSAFYSANDLRGVTIPKNVTSIEDNAFANILLFDSVTVHATTPPTAGTNIFDSVSDLSSRFRITVPAGCGDAYKAADGWSTYADYIVEAT